MEKILDFNFEMGFCKEDHCLRKNGEMRVGGIGCGVPEEWVSIEPNKKHAY